ncbi:hypothetical protein [Alistipes finegoldii]|uniref:hypothetical protein n=1 Tax=Alistipes finegoldii TaxID=214856 RepID=UPI00242C898F|nr:hypothetical protein [Alistipes finegoldii]
MRRRILRPDRNHTSHSTIKQNNTCIRKADPEASPESWPGKLVRKQIAKQILKQARKANREAGPEANPETGPESWSGKLVRKAGPESESEPDSGQNRRNATGISGDVDPSRGRPTDSAERPSN